MKKFILFLIAAILTIGAADAQNRKKAPANQGKRTTATARAKKSTTPAWLIGEWRRYTDDPKYIMAFRDFRLKIGKDKIQFGEVAKDFMPHYDGPYTLNGNRLTFTNEERGEDHEYCFILDLDNKTIYGPLDAPDIDFAWEKTSNQCVFHTPETETIEDITFQQYTEVIIVCDDDEEDNGRQFGVVEIPAPEAPRSTPAPANTFDTIYDCSNVQQQPQFPGGDAALYKWIDEHKSYPADAAKEGVEGRVLIEFLVDNDGSIKNARVVKSKHPALDKEAVRVVSSMPKWNPGRVNGQPVKVNYILPITFRLTR